MRDRQTRIAWLDVARGGTMILVILWHSYLAARTIGAVDPIVTSVNENLATVRMPMFFFCSGMLAFWGLNRDWSTIVTGRIWTMIWIYMVWSTLTLLLDQAYPVTPWRSEAQNLSSFLWLSYGSQWFIYALVCATVFARAVFFLPLPVQVAAVAAAQVGLHAWSPEFDEFTTNLDYLVATMASYGLLFFMSGIWLSKHVMPLLDRGSRAFAGFVGGLALWAAVLGAESMMPGDAPTAITAAPGVFAGLALAALLSLVRPVRQPLEWVGQRTLEIFVCHQFVVGLLTMACVSLGLAPDLAFLAIAAGTCATAVAFAWLATAGGPRVMFRPPSFALWRARPAAI